MKQLITLCAALTLALSTSAFANSHKEAPGMAASGPMAGGAMSATVGRDWSTRRRSRTRRRKRGQPRDASRVSGR